MLLGFLTALGRAGRKLRNNVAVPLLKVEVASSPEAQHYGLMYRRNLSVNSGMLFDFGQTKPLAFWMKETYIPLQIAFIDTTGKVGQIERMSPLSTRSIRSHASYRYALEVNDGWFDRHEIRIGAQLQLPGAQPQAQQPAAVIVPFKDILREANRHYDLRLLIGYQTKDGEETAPQVIRTPFTFVNTEEGDHDGVIKAAIEGPAVQEAGPAVRKVSQPSDPTEDRIRSFIVDNIVSISDLQGNPITSVAQVVQLAQSQPRPTATSRYHWLKFAQANEEEYDVLVYVNPASGYDVWCLNGTVGTRPATSAAKGNFKTLDEALSTADNCVRSRLGNFAAPPNVVWVSTDPPMDYPNDKSQYVYCVTLLRPQGGSWHTYEGLWEPSVPGQRGSATSIREQRQDLPKTDSQVGFDVLNEKWRALDPKRQPQQIAGLPIGFRSFQGHKHVDWFVVDPFGAILAHSPIRTEAEQRAGHNIWALTKWAVAQGLPTDMMLVDSGGKDFESTWPRYSVFDKEKLIARSNDIQRAIKLAKQSKLPIEASDEMEYWLLEPIDDDTEGLRVKRCTGCKSPQSMGYTPSATWLWVGDKYQHSAECPFNRGPKPPEDFDMDEANRMLEEMRPTGGNQAHRLAGAFLDSAIE